ncbi:MAG: ribonuclease D [Pseudomonadota bacterium]
MQVITDTKSLEAACRDLSTAEFVTVDTEFMREQTFWPKLCLIQAASAELELIIDPLADGIDLSAFWGLMTNERVVKVFHAARQDIEIVYAAAKDVPRPVFDSQVAAMVCGFGDSVSYVNLVKHVTGTNLDKSSRFTDWSRRPLSKKQLAYAIGDVTHLRDIYLFLREKLAKSERESWLDEEMATLTSPDTYITAPEEAWRRLKLRVKNRRALAVLIELAAWRERIAQEQDVPRGRVLRDDALYDIANQMPDTTESLSDLRSLSEGFSRSSRAKEIIQAVKTGLDRDTETVPPLRQGKPLSADQSATLELLKVLLKAAAARHDVAARIIADASDLEALARNDGAGIQAMKGWRRQLFGEDALRLKNGQIALTLKDGDVKTIPVSTQADATDTPT